MKYLHFTLDNGAGNVHFSNDPSFKWNVSNDVFNQTRYVDSDLINQMKSAKNDQDAWNIYHDAVNHNFVNA